MKYKAIISAHIYIDENGNKDFEPLSIIHNDVEGTDIFCDIDHALLEDIDVGDSEDYYFMAIVESEFVEHKNWEGSEWDVEHEITEIKKIEDIKA